MVATQGREVPSHQLPGGRVSPAEWTLLPVGVRRAPAVRAAQGGRRQASLEWRLQSQRRSWSPVFWPSFWTWVNSYGGTAISASYRMETILLLTCLSDKCAARGNELLLANY